VTKWREAGLLQPLDTSKITGWKDLNPGIMAMKNLATTDDGKAWFIAVGLGQHAAHLQLLPDRRQGRADSLKAFADPKFKGRVSIGDNVDDAYALASLAIGLRDWTKDDGRPVQACVRLPAPGAQERPLLLDRHHRHLCSC